MTRQEGKYDEDFNLIEMKEYNSDNELVLYEKYDTNGLITYSNKHEYFLSKKIMLFEDYLEVESLSKTILDNLSPNYYDKILTKMGRAKAYYNSIPSEFNKIDPANN